MTSRTDDRGVVEVLDSKRYVEQNPGADVVTCGHCKRSWDDAVITGWTPVPSARCPFEYEHDYGEDSELNPELTDVERDEIIAAGMRAAGEEEFIQLVLNSAGPGAFEGIEERQTAMAIHALYLNGGTDQDGGNVEYGLAYSRCGRAVLWTDSNGFHTLQVFDTEQEAERACDEEGVRQGEGEGDEDLRELDPGDPVDAAKLTRAAKEQT